MKKSYMKTGTRLERFTDWTIGLFSPKTKARRMHFRLFANNSEYRENFMTMMSARGYRSARASKHKTPWLGGTRTADAEVLNDLTTLSSRSRELNRDDPIGSGLTHTFTTNVIGTGMKPQAQTGDPEKNKNIESVFADRKNNLALADDMTHGQTQRVKFKKWFEDGGVLIKQAKRTPDEPVWFETVEIDRIRSPLGQKALDKKGSIRHGVEKDAAGIPVAYWVLKSRPATAMMGSVMPGVKDAYERVPKEVAVHLRFAGRPGQTHGVPRFHAISQDIRDLDLLILAGLKRTQIAACLAVFIKSNATIEEMFQETAKKEGYMLDQELEPGMMFKLGPTEEAQTLIPNFPTPEFVPFIIMLARRIGAALGVSWQIVLKDFSDANYSSARTDLLEARQTYKVYQEWIIEKYFNWEWRVVLEDAIMRGDPRMKGVKPEDLAPSKVHWIPNGWHWVDPVKESTATKIAILTKITTRRDECAKEGKDWEEVAEQLLQEELFELNRRKELGLPPPKPPEDPFKKKDFRESFFDSLFSEEDDNDNGNGKNKERKAHIIR